ncbi:MAG: GNAT family N-acetyltransferase [Thermotogota bacterium]
MFRIRVATHDDNEALLHLESESPQGTGMSILLDRQDYFYRSRMYDGARVVVAEEDGKIVGVMAYAVKEVLLDGGTDRVAYFYDLRGEATYRRSMKRGLLRLWYAVRDEIRETGAAFIFGHVKADNHDSMNVVTRMGAKPAASFDILSTTSLPGRRVDLDPHFDNLEEEVTKIARTVGARSLKPVDFLSAYARGAELGYLKGIYRLESGDSFAQVSAWDLSKIYYGRVLRMPLWIRLLGDVLNPLSNVLPVPRIPVVGQQIAYLQLFDPMVRGAQGQSLLSQLVLQLRRNARANGTDILTLFLYRDDPLARMPRAIPNTALHYHTMVCPVRTEALPKPPLYLDIRDI